MNSLGVETMARIGIKEWLVPQISEHCPVNSPTRLDKRKIWFNRPGRASTFIPKDGMVHEWITSADETKPRINIFTGRYTSSLVFRSRRMFDLSMKFSVSREFNDEYSYDQYHWCPLIFNVILGDFVSSIRYKVFREGRAIKISSNAGRIVQIVSISCPSITNLLNFFLIISDKTRWIVRIVIKVKMIIAWSWKNIICSIAGEILSWNDKAVHLGIR